MIDGVKLRDGIAIHGQQSNRRVQASRRATVVVFSVENGFVDARIVNPRQAVKFKQAGGRILHETRKFPYWR